MAGFEVIPSARRLIRSLRDLGYDFPQAVADVVDNSIAAGSTLVAIDVEFAGDDSWVRIADNGVGMTPAELREALRFGADRDYEVDDLGKFGLGLKTASLSQCQCLSVASRHNADRTDICGYAWDLHHIERTNRWEILPLDRTGLGPAIRQPLKETTGTVVLWQRLDRLLGYKHPYGEFARKRLGQMCRDLEIHLGMVFHRFLAGEVSRKRLKILLNGNEVIPWDPFCRSETRTRTLEQVILPIEHEGIRDEIVLEPFVLPHQEEFSSPEAFRAASGPANWNQQQGFYVYRADRMIQSGGWSYLRSPDEHTKLARIALHFLPDMDEAFKINVAKMRVQLPTSARDAIRDAVTPVTRLAREVYDRRRPKGPPPPTRDPSPAPTTGARPGANGTATRTEGGHGGRGFSPAAAGPLNAPTADLLTVDQWCERTRSAASATERPVIDAVLARLRAPAENE